MAVQTCKKTSSILTVISAGVDNPEQITPPVNINAISCGAYHSILLGVDGNIYSYGRNDRSQTGSAVSTYVDAPAVVSIGAWTASGSLSILISSGSSAHHTLAVASGTTLVAFGYNSAGQVGDGTSGNT
jgi:alpha-tubulin suppressor-like RCC1 family protein